MKYQILAVLFFILGADASLQAQTAEGADFFQSIGKIYVVVGVIALIFIGVIIFLIYLDRKITLLEQQIKQNE